MSRYSILLTGIVGLIALMLVLPSFDSAQPKGISIGREEARRIAEVAARDLGIPIDEAWVTLVWDQSFLIQGELQKNPELFDRAWDDPILGPRMGGFMAIYWRKGLEKYPYWGHVVVGRDGAIVESRKFARAEEEGANSTEADLRPIADEYLRSLDIARVGTPEFESARPDVLRGRTDYAFRYKIRHEFPLDDVSTFVNIHFIGDELAGWTLIEEYSDGRNFRFEGGDELITFFLQYGIIGIVLITLLVIFLKKYHSGEVGIGTGAILAIAYVVLSIAVNFLTIPEQSRGTGFGGSDAMATAMAVGGFKFLFYDLPVAMMLMFGWSVGESYARERWGDRLASLDALARRHPWNATVGRAFVSGVILAPAVAAAILVPAYIGLMTGIAHPDTGAGTHTILGTSGGPLAALIYNLLGAILGAVVSVLFVLSFFNRLRLLPLGFLVAAFVGIAIGTPGAPIGPTPWQLFLGFGGVLAGALIFYFGDTLSAAVALFCGSMLATSLPYLQVATGDAATGTWVAMVTPLVGFFGLGVSGLLTRREIVYEYEDLAPHVRKIMERERIRAEIDAANRIQAALLPDGDPDFPGLTVASHYRAATEIGGDYYDFLEQPNGDIGIAFGDVAGHGLTSGIVMSMAKSALLVQLGYDSSPKRVMEVLNEIVIKVAPKRMMMTFFFGLLDPHAMTLRFSSAGHLDPYVFRARENRLLPLSAWGYPLGIRRRDPFKEMEISFQQGDRLILYSDGLIEAINDDEEPFGFKRFEEVLLSESHRPAGEIRKSLLDAVKKFTSNRPPEDDQTLVIFSFDRAQIPAPLSDLEREDVAVN